MWLAVLIGDLRAEKQRKSQHHLLVLPYPLVRALSKIQYHKDSVQNFINQLPFSEMWQTRSWDWNKRYRKFVQHYLKA